jgi:heavy metal translocating P-type ATPase
MSSTGDSIEWLEGRAAVLQTDSTRLLLLLGAAIGLGLGLTLWWFDRAEWAQAIWATATLAVLLALLLEIVTSLRRGDVGLDIVAALSMAAALFLGEQLAAIVVALMYSGGQYLEAFAEQRASRNLTALLSRVPRTALLERDGELVEVSIDDIEPESRLLIRRGDLVPVDGKIAHGIAVLDQSALTGEAVPMKLTAGEAIPSGSMNVGDAFGLIAVRRARDSRLAGIVRLVESARRSKAPMSRLADRFAIVFLALTLLLALAAWVTSDDPVRALAVLVIATPCPLILAVPVAIISGVSRAASVGVLVKGGSALETLAKVRVLVFDKTGTLTYGRARLVKAEPEPGLSEDELLRLAASADQASRHVIAQAIVSEAHRRELVLMVPTSVEEIPGDGVKALVEDQEVAVGGYRFVARHLMERKNDLASVDRPGTAKVFVSLDGRLAGTLILADRLRSGAADLIHRLRRLGLRRIIIASGDRSDVTEAVASGLGLDAIHAELTPEAKIDVILHERLNGPVMMVGDGVNDAPALAAADVGVAMGSSGTAASAEAADIVLLVDDLAPIARALVIARRSCSIALQSVFAGIGLSFVGMLVAAAGYLKPLEGALIQEVIDVAVILNALRALGGGPVRP